MLNKISLGAKRVGVAIALFTWVILSVFYGGIPLAIFFGVFMFIGSKELGNMARAKGMNPPLEFIIGANLLFLAFAMFGMRSMLFALFAVLMVLALLLILFRGKNATLNDISITMFAVVYGGLFPVHAIMIRNMQESYFAFAGHDYPIGIGLAVLTFFAVPAGDIGAFYAGRYFGKHPLWKEISPKKTVEGSIGGAIASMLFALTIGHFIGIGLMHSIIVGLLISALAQLGDLAESMIKRDAGVKDSGDIFPGHGGVLDRADSYILSVVAAYYYFQLFIV